MEETPTINNINHQQKSGDIFVWVNYISSTNHIQIAILNDNI